MPPSDQQKLVTLINWLSPSFPTGAFSFSHGLETAFSTGVISTRDQFAEWLSNLLTRGSGWNDAIFCAHAWRIGRDNLASAALCELCNALAPSQERYEETTAQGAAFLKAARPWMKAGVIDLPNTAPLPIALGQTAGAYGVDLHNTLLAMLNSFISNLIQVSLRLGHFGQADGVILLEQFTTPIINVAEQTAEAGLDELGGSTLLADIMSMQHEDEHSRIFLS